MKKINVLYLSTTGKGGATYSLLNMIDAVKQYVNPIVVFPDKNGVYTDFLKKGIECIIVPFQEEIFYAGQFKEYHFIRKIRFILGRIRNLIRWNKKFNANVKKELGNRKIDIVHTNNGAVDLGVSLSKALKAKHVWHLREFQDLDFNARPFFGWKRFNSLLSESDAVICITKAIAKHFNILSNHKNGTFIWNAIAKKEDAVFIKEKSPYICFIASMISPGKGLHDLLAAFSKSELVNKNIKLVVIGRMDDPNYKQRIMNLANDLRITKLITFIDYTNSTKEIISKAMALAMPSESEALGRVMIEAMFYGCPAIARNSGGPAEYITNKKNGFLFNNTDELTEILNIVCSTNQEELIKTSQNFAINNFSEEIYANKILDVYNKVMTL